MLTFVRFVVNDVSGSLVSMIPVGVNFGNGVPQQICFPIMTKINT